MKKYIAKPKHTSKALKKKRKRARFLSCPDEWSALRQRCLASIASFQNDAPRIETPVGPYFFNDNGSDVLAVAHLDTIQNDRHFGCLKDEPNRVYNCQLDDRLGAWIILDLLPSMGIKTDILLTTGEERGMSTASSFDAPKEYNWIVEFDRSGTDVVTYDMESEEWCAALRKGNKIGYGSYSDIAELKCLRVCAVNWGIGYYHGHYLKSYFNVSELVSAMERFYRFFSDNLNVHYPMDVSAAFKSGRFDDEKFWENYYNEQARECIIWEEEQERKYAYGVDNDSVYS